MFHLAITVVLVVPDTKKCEDDSSRDDSKVLDIRGILKVVKTKIMTLFKYRWSNVLSTYIMVDVSYFSRLI